MLIRQLSIRDKKTDSLSRRVVCICFSLIVLQRSFRCFFWLLWIIVLLHMALSKILILKNSYLVYVRKFSRKLRLFVINRPKERTFNDLYKIFTWKKVLFLFYLHLSLLFSSALPLTSWSFGFKKKKYKARKRKTLFSGIFKRTVYVSWGNLF